MASSSKTMIIVALHLAVLFVCAHGNQRSPTAIEGVVYCKYCYLSQRYNKDMQASPIEGATVTLECDYNTPPVMMTTVTDKNGFFDFMTGFEVSASEVDGCRVTVTSPLPFCDELVLAGNMPPEFEATKTAVNPGDSYLRPTEFYTTGVIEFAPSEGQHCPPHY